MMWMSVVLSMLVCAACQQSVTTEKTSSSTASGEVPTVTVTTSFLADMVYQLAGDAVNIQVIIPAGEDPHVYVAKASDLKKLETANKVLYHGLHFEGKMVEALESKGVAVSKNFPEDQLNKMEEDGESVVDPHFWFDIALYKNATETVSVELQTLLPQQAEKIKDRTRAYLKELDELDVWIKEQLASIPEENRYLITPHDAFQYFARAYQVSIHAPQGISTDSEVANKDMMETVDLIVQHKIKAIFAESTTNPDRMEKLREAVKAKGADVKVVSGEGQELFSDSLAPKGEEGDTYIDMYKHNVQLMVENLK